MNREGRTVNVKDWGRLGAKRVVLYEDRGELRFTDGFHDMRMTQARMEAFVPGGDVPESERNQKLASGCKRAEKIIG